MTYVLLLPLINFYTNKSSIFFIPDSQILITCLIPSIFHPYNSLLLFIVSLTFSSSYFCYNAICRIFFLAYCLLLFLELVSYFNIRMLWNLFIDFFVFSMLSGTFAVFFNSLYQRHRYFLYVGLWILISLLLLI